MAQSTSETCRYAVDTGFWYPVFFLTGLFSAAWRWPTCCPSCLDGGRLFFVILEWIWGSPHSTRARSRLPLVGHRAAADAHG